MDVSVEILNAVKFYQSYNTQENMFSVEFFV